VQEAEGKGHKGIPDIFRSLRYRNYRLFFIGQSISLVGTWVQRIALPWLVYDQTGSAFLLGIVAFAGQIPTFLFAPIAGAIIDRYDRHKVLVISQYLAMFQAIALTVCYYLGWTDPLVLIILAAALGTINAFDMPSRQSMVVDLVDDRRDLGNAIALNSSMFNAARLIGPSIAGLLMALTDEGVCFMVNAASFVFVIYTLSRMRIRRTVTGKRTTVVRGMAEGFVYSFGFPPVRTILLLLILICLLGVPYMTLIPVFVKGVLQGNASSYGFLMGATGLGALGGALYLASRRSIEGLISIMALSAGLFGTGLLLFSFSRWMVPSLVLMFLVGLGMITAVASSNTMLQTITDDDKRARVMSFYAMSIMGATPVGSLIAGALAERLGAAFTIMLCGLAVLLAATFFSFGIGSLSRQVRSFLTKEGIMTEVAKGLRGANEPAVQNDG